MCESEGPYWADCLDFAFYFGRWCKIWIEVKVPHSTNSSPHDDTGQDSFGQRFNWTDSSSSSDWFLQSKHRPPKFHHQLTMTNVSSGATEILDGDVYAGVPLSQSSSFRSASVSKSELAFANLASNTRGRCDGLLAFVTGLVLAAVAWVPNQGWVLVSFLLFDQCAWQRMMFCIFGCICTSIAFWSIFVLCFPGVKEVYEDYRAEETPRVKDISGALHDLKQLGFALGYIGSQYLLSTRVYNITFEYTACTRVSLVILMLMWVTYTKVRNLKRAIKRASNVSVEPPRACAV